MISLNKRLWIVAATLAFGFGCDGEPATDAGMDDPDTGMTTSVAPSCEAYCTAITANCTGMNAVYASVAECMSVCGDITWADGDDVTESGPIDGNTLACRQYHAGVAADDGDLHCPHAADHGAGVCGSLCEAYCEMALSICTGADELYASGEECMTACAAFDDSGSNPVSLATSGDTVQCRLYHLGVASREDMRSLHCPHAAADGGGVCVGGWTFSTTDPSDYTRVDAMGMPAVATALISAAMKNAYNDASPANTGFVGEMSANLTALHTALDDDLTSPAVDLTPCTMTPVGTQRSCLSQEIATGVSVASLVVPDDLTLNLTADAGFPNGRLLSDPVIDVTLSILLLDVDILTTTRIPPAPPPHDPTTLVGVLNPDMNDATLLTEFPYFAPPHAP